MFDAVNIMLSMLITISSKHAVGKMTKKRREKENVQVEIIHLHVVYMIIKYAIAVRLVRAVTLHCSALR